MSITVAAGPIPLAVICRSPRAAESLRRRYEPFLTAEPPALRVEVTLGDPGPRAEAVSVDGHTATMEAAHVAARFDLAAGSASLLAPPERVGEAVELALRVACALLAFKGGGLLIHGAAIAGRSGAHLFLGPSGAGKTTASRNAAGRRVLNDDLVVLWPGRPGWQAHATPFTNPSQVQPPGPGHAPLAAIHHLVQAPHVARVPMSTAAAVARLTARVPIIAVDPARGAALLHRAASICGIVSSDYLHLRPDPSFWQVVEQAD